MESFFSKKNYLGFLLGIVMLGIGFYCLSMSPAQNKVALNFAPIILVFAFAVVIPVSIMLGSSKGKEK